MATELTIWPTRSTHGPKGSFSCVIVIIADNKQKFYDKINEENIQLCWHVQSKLICRMESRNPHALNTALAVLELPHPWGSSFESDSLNLAPNVRYSQKVSMPQLSYLQSACSYRSSYASMLLLHAFSTTRSLPMTGWCTLHWPPACRPW